MKKEDESNVREPELQEFFDELKALEFANEIPELEPMLEDISQKSNPSYRWYYAAAAALVAGLVLHQLVSDEGGQVHQKTEIIISYEVQEDHSENELLMEGMDQWQSETDIFLTGL